MNTPRKILETNRLLLRRLIPDDLDALYALYRDPEMRRYFPVEGASPDKTLTYEETREELEWFLNGHPQRPELGLWATLLKANGAFIGRCGLLPWTIDGQDEVEVAFMIDKRYWRQGLGAEAARGIRDYAFEQLGLSRLICMIDPENAGSIGVATAIGMTFEKECVDEHGPFWVYAMAAPG
jgi:ribosomal-protein-alanine N-acetyltransferase